MIYTDPVLGYVCECGSLDVQRDDDDVLVCKRCNSKDQFEE